MARIELIKTDDTLTDIDLFIYWEYTIIRINDSIAIEWEYPLSIIEIYMYANDFFSF